jgi:spore coat protein U-like protein
VTRAWNLLSAVRPMAMAGLLATISALAAPPTQAANCTLSAQGVVFGIYDTLANQNLDGTGSVSVSCDTNASFTVALSPGHGTTLLRQMQGGADVMTYNLFTDSLRSIIWGDGAGGTALANGSGTSVTYAVYGRIPPGQKIRAGAYSDSITVTLSF